MTGDGRFIFLNLTIFRLPVAERANYKNVFNCLSRIIKDEGVTTLWRGSSPTVARAMALNGVQLAGYTQAKQMLLTTPYFKDNTTTHFVASVISGFFATVVSIPIDITKTRLQTMKIVNGVPQYTGALDVLSKTIKAEGVLALWKGFTPYFLKLGPHTIFTFSLKFFIFNFLVFLEKLNAWYLKQ
jgi:solute carrier family 25 (mitochondrial oxoglutarate transporter), member 11